MAIKHMGTVAGSSPALEIFAPAAIWKQPVGQHAQRGTESRIHPEANTITLLSQITIVITTDPVEMPQIPTQ